MSLKAKVCTFLIGENFCQNSYRAVQDNIVNNISTSLLEV